MLSAAGLTPSCDVLGPRALMHRPMLGRGFQLVLPFWPTSYFWPLIFSDGSHGAPFVRSSVRFHGRYVMGNTLDTCVFNNAPKFDSLALQVNFEICRLYIRIVLALLCSGMRRDALSLHHHCIIVHYHLYALLCVMHTGIYAESIIGA